jgi:hypothetical protein
MSAQVTPALVSVNRGRFGERETVIEEWRGKSTDTKPERPADRHGSTFFEMDTSNAYMYDGETLTWLLL